MKKMLVMEFNELCPSLLERFMDEGQLPNFAKLKKESSVMLTLTNATGEDLNPWIQWLDVHTGQDWESHGIKLLNRINDFEGKFVWDLLSEKYGIKNWICGSMNAKFSEPFIGRFLPDPWCVDVDPSHNDSMRDYYDFVSQSVQNHSGEVKTSQTSFIRSLLNQNVRISTILGLAFQIIKEKIFENETWKRAIWLDKIQLDVFNYYYKKEQPEFATFFSNAVAHFQHHYWDQFEPEKFANTQKNQDGKLKDAILKAYKNTDYLVGKLCQAVDSETAIVFATALSQEPYTDNQRFYYNINSKATFFEKFDIPVGTILKPIMAEQFYLEFPSVEAAIEAQNNLDKYVMNSNDYFHVGSNHVFLLERQGKNLQVQCRCTKMVSDDAYFFDENAPDTKTIFSDCFYKMNEIKTGKHNPFGLYWFKDPSNKFITHKENVKPSQIHNDIVSYFS